MDFTKGLPCPCCDNTARFQGGQFGGLITATNIVCDCGFSALVVVNKEGYEFEVSATPEDREKANPYIQSKTEVSDIIVQKHYIEKLIKETKGNRRLYSELTKALSFAEDAIK